MKRLRLLFIFIIIFVLISCDSVTISSPNPFFALDTVISITFYNTPDYEKHYKEIKNIYYEVNDVASDFLNSNLDSVYYLNENRSIIASNTLKELIEYSLFYYNETKGAFNPFIGRLAHLWKDSIKNNCILDIDVINNELSIMNNTSISIVGNNISIIGDGNLDLGGIAKGYATLKASEYLKENGIDNFFINAGKSNILCGKTPYEYFRLGLDKPYGNGYFKVFDASEIAICTSSGENQNVLIEGNRYHHLINPFSGYPSNIYDSVVVLGNNSMDLDVYSTAISMMEYDDAVRFSEEHNIDIILYKDNEIIYEGKNIYEKKK